MASATAQLERAIMLQVESRLGVWGIKKKERKRQLWRECSRASAAVIMPNPSRQQGGTGWNWTDEGGPGLNKLWHHFRGLSHAVVAAACLGNSFCKALIRNLAKGRDIVFTVMGKSKAARDVLAAALPNETFHKVT